VQPLSPAFQQTTRREQKGWSHVWEILTVLLIVAAAFVEYFVGNVSLRLLGPIAALGISTALIGFSLNGNFWRPKWVEASPGINLVRCTIVGLICLAALTVVCLGVGAWLGIVGAVKINALFLKAVLGLTMAGYYARRIANLPDSEGTRGQCRPDQSSASRIELLGFEGSYFTLAVWPTAARLRCRRSSRPVTSCAVS
jgi:hypothetical protein